MYLAKVTGSVVSTQKSVSLVGKKLLLVRRVTAEGELPQHPTHGDDVAVDSVGAGVGELDDEDPKGHMMRRRKVGRVREG